MNIENQQELTFSFDQFFFSRTNHKGVILSGNSVFQFLSGYSWDELLLKPHNIIRHNQMPKGVFYLLWDYLLKGKSVAAYVVNQTKDGKYYWVFALVNPTDEGYLSVRIRPSSEVLDIIKPLYSKLKHYETTNKLTPKDLCDLLLNEIKNLKFTDYSSFMTYCLSLELASCQKNRNKTTPESINLLSEIYKCSESLDSHCSKIEVLFSNGKYIPLNLDIKANLIGDLAKTISVISNQYSILTRDINRCISSFLNLNKPLKEIVDKCRISVCSAFLQNEIYTQFKNDESTMPFDKNLDMSILHNLNQSYHLQSQQNLIKLNEIIHEFQYEFEQLLKQVTSLDIVFITAKIESAKILQENNELVDLIKLLEQFKSDVKILLNEINIQFMQLKIKFDQLHNFDKKIN